MNPASLVLEYIKTLIWPVILVSALVVYSDELLGILEDREIEAFGIKIGKQIDDVSSSYKAELEALKEQIKSSTNNEAALRKIETIEKGLDKELAYVRTSAITQQAPTTTLTSREQVNLLEREGFEAILNHDITQAIEAFSSARDVWPDFHNISEIRALLVNRKQVLSNENNQDEWRSVIEKILEEYSWGMPADIRERLVESKMIQ